MNHILKEYPLNDFYHEIDASSCYLLNLSLRDMNTTKRIYETIKDKVRSYAIDTQSNYEYHINDAHVAHALAKALEDTLHNPI